MTTVCQLHSTQLQKETKSNPKQPKVCGPQEDKDVKSKVAAKKWL